MLYLLRYPEIGKEPHPEKSKARNDILDSLRERLPGARVTTEIGRVYVEHEQDAREILAQIHGVTSFSPCERCDLAELNDRVLDLARRTVEHRSFALRVRRVGHHTFRSQELARTLGAQIVQEIPGARVNLGAPEVELGIEIRDEVVYLFHEIIPGLDERAIAERTRYEEPRFIVDHMLGTLATRLRLLGFDTTFYRDTADSLLLRKSDEERRLLLTQDHGLARLGGAAAYLVQARELEAQVSEVIDLFQLKIDEQNLLSRCSICNERLEHAPKDTVQGLVPERVFAEYDAFLRCPSCARVYWKGTHHERMVLIPEG